MKRILIIITFTAACFGVKAQSAMSHGKWEENTHTKSRSHVQQPNEFSETEIAVEHRMATFSNLPGLKKGTWAVVTDANGEVMTQKRISPENNYVDLRRLQKGQIYYVTLIYKNKSRKAFVIHP